MKNVLRIMGTINEEVAMRFVEESDEIIEAYCEYLEQSEFVKEDLSNNNGTLFIHDGGELLIKEKELDAEAIKKLEAMLQVEINEIARAEKMLSNPNFLAKAPKEKVDQEKEKLSKHLEAKANIEAKLNK